MAPTAQFLRNKGGTITDKLATELSSIASELTSESGVNLTAASTTGSGTGHPVFEMGNMDAAKSVGITDDFAPFQIYMKSSANATADATSFIGEYIKVENITIDQPHTRMQALLVNTRLNYDCYDAYAVQGHVTVATEMKTENTNAHITGISGKAVMTASATKGWVTGGLFIVEGAGLASEMCSVVSLVQESGCAAAQEMLYINNDGTATKGIYFVGNFTKGIDFAGGTFTQGTANGVITYGDIDTTKSLTPTDSIIPLQVNITSIADSGTSGNQTVGATYFRTACTTAHQPNHQLATDMIRTAIGKNIWDAYGVQSHLGISASMQTTGDNAHITAISGKITMTNTPTVAKGWVTAGLFIIDGLGAVTQKCHGVAIVAEATTTAGMCTALLYLDADIGVTSGIEIVGGANMTYALKIDGATGAAVVAAGQPAGHSAAGYISVYVGASAYAIPFWAVGDMANS